MGQRTNHFRKLSVQDFGLNPTDTDAHVPQFFMISKWPKTDEQGPASTRALHTRSAKGKAHDKNRQRENGLTEMGKSTVLFHFIWSVN